MEGDREEERHREGSEEKETRNKRIATGPESGTISGRVRSHV